MKLLFDENLSHRLVGSLASLFPGSTHVREVGLERADDRAIWTYAIEHGHAIVPKEHAEGRRSFSLGTVLVTGRSSLPPRVSISNGDGTGIAVRTSAMGAPAL